MPCQNTWPLTEECKEEITNRILKVLHDASKRAYEAGARRSVIVFFEVDAEMDPILELGNEELKELVPYLVKKVEMDICKVIDPTYLEGLYELF